MSHIHQLDGKPISYPNGQCPICNPKEAGQPQTTPTEVLPRVYRKGNTIVTKISKGTMATVTYWVKGKAYLMSISHMARDQADNVIRGSDGNPVWNKSTVRLSPQILKDFLFETDMMYHEIEGGAVVTARQ